MSSTYSLPEDFLDSPAPNLTRSVVDFAAANLTEYHGYWAVILDNVMTEHECDQLVAAAEATTNAKWERALVNIGGGMQAMCEDTRKCGRIIWDNRELMAKLWARIEPSVPEIYRLKNCASITGNGPAKHNEVWKASRLNDRARFLKYVGGEYFKAHCDGTYETPDRTERSYFTLHLYLTDAEAKDGQEPLVGGATTFYSWNMKQRIDVVPKCGRVLIFQHRGLLHSGDDVESGVKLTMRTDIMYAKEKEEEAIGAA
ncbi:oxidoreductase domain-containing protein [Ampelomyces quisqualis]|uniref:Oxidoreductase domain-containing protein n=1 Tax=Ampelomyces quisqualis TaxID=50730 RepID=A0A6A5QFX1_AMPQU|nr:oxidoreductase domain-containing protein [Ampelomyces quisqualis]